MSACLQSNQKVANLVLSIITVNKDNAIGLARTLQSLGEQSFQKFQWIFMDGASVDESCDLARNFMREGDIFVSQRDGGIYNAMNEGLKYVSGSRVLFLNSGDILSGDKCVSMVEEHWEKELDLLLLGFSVRNRIRMPKGNLWRYWSMPTSHQSIVYSTKLMNNHKFDEKFRYAADFEHYLRVNLKRLKIRRVRELFSINEPYGSDLFLNQVLNEYREALIKNGYQPAWAALSCFIKKHYLNYILA